MARSMSAAWSDGLSFSPMILLATETDRSATADCRAAIAAARSALMASSALAFSASASSRALARISAFMFSATLRPCSMILAASWRASAIWALYSSRRRSASTRVSSAFSRDSRMRSARSSSIFVIGGNANLPSTMNKTTNATRLTSISVVFGMISSTLTAPPVAVS